MATKLISPLAKIAAIAFLCYLVAGLTSRAGNKNSGGVQISQLSDRLRVEVNGLLFTEYFYTNVPRPFCYPVIGPGGVGTFV